LPPPLSMHSGPSWPHSAQARAAAAAATLQQIYLMRFSLLSPLTLHPCRRGRIRGRQVARALLRRPSHGHAAGTRRGAGAPRGPRVAREAGHAAAARRPRALVRLWEGRRGVATAVLGALVQPMMGMVLSIRHALPPLRCAAGTSGTRLTRTRPRRRRPTPSSTSTPTSLSRRERVALSPSLRPVPRLRSLPPPSSFLFLTPPPTAPLPAAAPAASSA